MQTGLDDLQSEVNCQTQVMLHPRQTTQAGSHELISPFSPQGRTLTHQIFL
jgi:hypothetical protein